ncbi:discoidin domain-containing protein [Undibacterium piscinae]|uniref:Discoidin domain-containing protein n=2 Tax=Undibacterium TaxID=401469 RepID=A0A6M4A7U7_9BURK|nr:discoidin domain-containing protein [Undibacterium piscinae]
MVSGVLPRTVAKVIAYDSQTVSDGAANVLNDNPMNAWTSADSAFPHYLTVDLGGVRQVNGLSYLPKQEARSNIYEGNIANYQVLVSLDAINWSLMGQGSWAKTISMSSVNFSTVNARYVKLLALSEVNGGRVVSAAEVRVLGS